jgi:hypothetical protein
MAKDFWFSSSVTETELHDSSMAKKKGFIPFFNASGWELYAHLFGILDLILPS